jgi:hypothetical protein
MVGVVFRDSDLLPDQRAYGIAVHAPVGIRVRPQGDRQGDADDVPLEFLLPAAEPGPVFFHLAELDGEFVDAVDARSLPVFKTGIGKVGDHGKPPAALNMMCSPAPVMMVAEQAGPGAAAK